MSSANLLEAEEDEEQQEQEVSTLFVKNLHFDTTEQDLEDAFAAVVPVRSCSIAKKTAKNGATLSAGYGFIEFSSRDKAEKALRLLQGYNLDGHAIELKFANRGSSDGESGGRKRGRGTKLLVRNVPFEANKSELRDLFSTFGQIKSMRMPLKFDKTHRGFAFVDFVTQKEAKSAFDALKSTHLYGRHLVIEYAKDEQSVEALREKTAKFFEDEGVGARDANRHGRKRIKIGDE
eukprot:TRINITY_DN1656_c0_g3_i1.p2 TRINITY_DN1656_c0_g3~~TRINITY_DN1656_c0_g3_i1.p2  ORF type:complete len:234 (-),score=99.90 TRINITY_DN1656_c0_g3_i1:663-1364(-)